MPAQKQHLLAVTKGPQAVGSITTRFVVCSSEKEVQDRIDAYTKTGHTCHLFSYEKSFKASTLIESYSINE